MLRPSPKVLEIKAKARSEVFEAKAKSLKVKVKVTELFIRHAVERNPTE